MLNVKSHTLFVTSVIVIAMFLLGTTFGTLVSEEGHSPNQSTHTPAGFFLNDTLPFLSKALKLNQINNSTILYLVVDLSIDAAEAQEYVNQVSSKGSSLYHKYLTQAEFMSEFGPSAKGVSAVENWLYNSSAQDLTLSTGEEISFEMPSSLAEEIFKVTIFNYKYEGTYFYANYDNPYLPASVSNFVTSITGLDDFGVGFGNSTPFITTQLIGGILTATPSDIKSYFDINSLLNDGYNGKGINGVGLTIGIIGYPDARYYETDIQAFWEYYGITYTYDGNVYYPSDTKIIIGGGSLPPWYDNVDSLEETLDVEWAGVTAPATAIDDVIYSAPSGGNFGFEYGFDQELSYVANTLMPNELSFSIGPPYNSISQSEVSNIHNYLLQASSEGVTIVAASGDYGYSSDGSTTYTVALDPYAIAVGGVTLSLTSSGIDGQSGWSGSGGGYVANNPTYDQPSYQNGVAPNNGYRDDPDISFPAAPSIAVYFDGSLQGGYGGTSFAAPMVAGILADTISISGGFGPDGFISQAIYSIGYSSGAYTDITSGNNGMPAGPWWDYLTGIGSVDSWNFAWAIHNYYYSGGGGGGGCVLNGTFIQTSMYDTVPVQYLKAGDSILSYDPVTASFVKEKITELNVSNVTSIVNINNGLLFVSGSHDQPIYIKFSNGTEEWIMVGYLNTSDSLFDPLNNTWILVRSIQTIQGNFTVYDIQGSKWFSQDGYNRSSYIANGILLDVKT